MNDDNSLQINIEAIDDASSVLQGVADSAQTMADDMGSAAQGANQALQTVSTNALDTADAVDSLGRAFILTAEEIAKIESSIADVDSALDGMQTATDNVGSQMETVASQVGSAWEASAATLTSEMQDIETKGGEAATGLATEWLSSLDEIAAQGNLTEEQVNAALAGTGKAGEKSAFSIGFGLMAVGGVLQQVGGGIKDFATSAVTAANDASDAFTNTKSDAQALAEQVQGLKDPTSEVSKEYQTLIDKENVLKATIEGLEVQRSGAKKTTDEMNASEAKRNAQLVEAQNQYKLLTQETDRFTNLQSNASQTTDSMTSAVNTQALAQVNLGVNYQDSVSSMNELILATGSVKKGLEAETDAVALHIQTGIDLKTTTNDVAGAFAGNGKALKDLGIEIQEGSKGNSALAAVTQTLGTVIKNHSDTMVDSIDKLGSHWNQLLIDLGKTQGAIQPVVNLITDIVTELDKFVSKYPTTSGVIFGIAAVFGLLLVALAGIVNIAAPLVIAYGLIELAGVTAGISTFIAWLPLIITIGFLVAAVIFFFAVLESNWPKLTKDVEVVTTAIIKYFTNLGTEISQQWKLTKEGFDILCGWIKDGWNDAVNFITNLFEGWYNKVKGWIDWIVNSLKSVASSIGSGVSGAVSGAASVVTDLIPHFANGGIVNSPTLALVGEAGPEAIIPLSMASGGNSSPLPSGLGGNTNGNIIVNITGAVWSTKDQATMLGNEIAKQVGRQLKLTSFR